MEEKNALIAAFEALGEKISRLERELELANMCKETAQNKATRLEGENEQLRKKLDSVNDYIKEMEGKGWQFRS